MKSFIGKGAFDSRNFKVILRSQIISAKKFGAFKSGGLCPEKYTILFYIFKDGMRQKNNNYTRYFAKN